MKTIFVKGDTLKEAVNYINNDITFFGFLSHTKAFLKELLVTPIDANIDDYLKSHGMDRKTLLDALMCYNIIEKETKIVNKNEHDEFSVSYKIPKKNFERKMRRLYISLFEQNEISESTIFEDGADAMGGATGCGSCLQGGGLNPGAGTYDVSLGVQRREIKTNTNKKEKLSDSINRNVYITKEQAQMLKEMGTTDAGDYQYTVPLNFNGGNDPAYDHNNMFAKGMPNKKKGIRRKTK